MNHKSRVRRHGADETQIHSRRNDHVTLRNCIFVVALIAGLFGFGVIASSFMEVARILFFVFVVLAVLSYLFGGYRRGPI